MSSPVISPTWGSEEDSWMVLYSLHNYFSMHALVWYHSHASWWQNFYLWDTENIFKESNFFRVFPPLAQSTKPMSSFIFHFYFFFFFFTWIWPFLYCGYAVRYMILQTRPHHYFPFFHYVIQHINSLSQLCVICTNNVS